MRGRRRSTGSWRVHAQKTDGSNLPCRSQLQELDRKLQPTRSKQRAERGSFWLWLSREHAKSQGSSKESDARMKISGSKKMVAHTPASPNYASLHINVCCPVRSTTKRPFWTWVTGTAMVPPEPSTHHTMDTEAEAAHPWSVACTGGGGGQFLKNAR